MTVKLIELLALRKQLQDKTEQLKQIQSNVLVDNQHVVRNIGKQGLDEIVADLEVSVAKVSMTQATHAYDWHAKKLRIVDIAIQQANHITEVIVDNDTMNDYIDPYVKAIEVGAKADKQ